MRFISSILTTTIAASVISACSSAATSPGVSGALPQVSKDYQLTVSSQAFERSNGVVKPATSRDLFIADKNGNDVTEYNAAGVLQNTITTGVSEPDAIAFDASGDLYVANLGSDTVTVYPPGNTTPSNTISSNCPNAIAISKANEIYVANACGNNTVSIYTSAGVLAQTLSAPQIENPQALTLDSNSVLYVANADSTTYPTGAIAVCTGSPPNRQCKKELTDHVVNPQALRLYTTDYLFVANDNGASSDVTRYKPYTDNNTYVDSWGVNDLNNPNSLRFDAFGHLCASSSGNDSVYCFVSPNVPSREVTKGIKNPTGLTFDSSGNLYVANDFKNKTHKGSWTQYCEKASCNTPTLTQYNGVDGPIAIGVNPT